MRNTLVPAILAATLVVAACSSDGSDDAAESDNTTEDSGTDDAESSTESADPTDDRSADEPTPDDTTAPDGDAEQAPPASGQGTATLTLASGETLEFDVMCALEPQIAAGSEILFTASSFGDLQLDITQFGDEGPVTDIGTVSVVDGSTFESLWGASTIYEPFGGTLELTLDGNTITGTGSFFPGDDPLEGGDPVDGEVIAEC